jgi:integrase
MATKAADLYKHDQTLERNLNKRLAGFGNDKDVVESFLNQAIAEGRSSARVNKYLHTLIPLKRLLKKDFTAADEDDVKRLAVMIERCGKKASTKDDYRSILKQFLRHLGKEPTWLKVGKGRNSRMLPEEVLSEDDIKRIVEAGYLSRDRAFILGLYESGCRIGEFLPLKLEHVTFDKHGAVLRVTGKTGARRVRLVFSTIALQRWISDHPKKSPDAYLWCKTPSQYNPKWENHHLCYGFVRRLLKELDNFIILNSKLLMGGNVLKAWKKRIVFVCILLLLAGCVQEPREPVACTQEAKICPDGTAVRRAPPDCEFTPCPTQSAPATNTPPPEHYPETPRLTVPPTNLPSRLTPPTTTLQAASPPATKVLLMKILLPTVISSLFIISVFYKKQSFPLSLNKWNFFAIFGAIFFLIAVFLTGKLEPKEQFVEVVGTSRVVINLFGTWGLYLKVLLPFLLLIYAKRKYPHGKLLHIHLTPSLKFHVIDLDVLVIIWFFMGFFDFLNNLLGYLTII